MWRVFRKYNFILLFRKCNFSSDNTKTKIIDSTLISLFIFDHPKWCGGMMEPRGKNWISFNYLQSCNIWFWINSILPWLFSVKQLWCRCFTSLGNWLPLKLSYTQVCSNCFSAPSLAHHSCSMQPHHVFPFFYFPQCLLRLQIKKCVLFTIACWEPKD